MKERCNQKQPQLELLSRQRLSSIGRILGKGDNFIQGKKIGKLRGMDEKGRVQTSWGDKRLLQGTLVVVLAAGTVILAQVNNTLLKTIGSRCFGGT